MGGKEGEVRKYSSCYTKKYDVDMRGYEPKTPWMVAPLSLPIEKSFPHTLPNGVGQHDSLLIEEVKKDGWWWGKRGEGGEEEKDLLWSGRIGYKAGGRWNE